MAKPLPASRKQLRDFVKRSGKRTTSAERRVRTLAAETDRRISRVLDLDRPRSTSIAAAIHSLREDTIKDLRARLVEQYRKAFAEGVRAFLANVPTRVVEQTRRELLADVENLVDPPTEEEALQAINKPLKGVRWWERLSTRLPKFSPDRAAALLSKALSEGKNPREAERPLRNFVRGYKNRSLVVARTEMLRAAQVAQREALSQFGPAVGGWQVLSAGDDRVRPEHAERNGNIYSDNPALDPDAPLDDKPDTPDAPNCRCVTVPVVAPDADLEGLAARLRRRQRRRNT